MSRRWRTGCAGWRRRPRPTGSTPSWSHRAPTWRTSSAHVRRLARAADLPGRPCRRRAAAAGADPGAARLVRHARRSRSASAIPTWTDGEDPYAALRAVLPAGARVLAVDYHMPAVHALERAGRRARLRAATGRGGDRRTADAQGRRRGRRAGRWRRRDRPGAAADRRSGSAAGRTENEVAADIAAAIVAEGHARADFVIVGSGPNGASPHHEAWDRVIGPGDVVVIDIGGPMPSRLLLRLHPHLRRRAAATTAPIAGQGPRGLRDRPPGAGGGRRGRPAGRDRRVRRRRRRGR